MAQKSIPESCKPKAPVRLPQRSEDVAGKERDGAAPVAAGEKKPGTAKAPAPHRH